MATIDDLHRRNQRLTEENLHLRADVCRLTELAASRHNLSVEDLEDMLNATQISADDAQARRMEAERAELEQRISELLARLDEANSTVEQLSAAGQERGRMLELATQHLQSQKEATDAAESRAAEVQARLQETEASRDLLQSRAAELESVVEALHEQVRQRDSDCAELQTTLEQMATAADAATAKMRQQHDRIKTAEGEVQKLRTLLDEQERDRAASRDEYSRLHEANVLMSYELDDRGQTILQLNERLQSAVAAADTYKKRSHKWKNAYHELADRCAKATSACALVSLTE